jgi:hypothetical protein
MLLGELLAEKSKLMPTDLLKAEVPLDVEEFKQAIDEAQKDACDLVAQGRILVEAAERLVCALYGLPSELEDEVVEHAMARAKATAANAP